MYKIRKDANLHLERNNIVLCHANHLDINILPDFNAKFHDIAVNHKKNHCGHLLLFISKCIELSQV